MIYTKGPQKKKKKKKNADEIYAYLLHGAWCPMLKTSRFANICSLLWESI